MAIQDPPLYLTLDNCKRGQAFNRDIFKEYTRTGPFIEFAVWPAVFLHKDGPLLCKGVVQCGKKSSSFRHSGTSVVPGERSRKATSLIIRATPAPLSTTLNSDEAERRRVHSTINIPATRECESSKF